jgi:hypothetical protein
MHSDEFDEWSAGDGSRNQGLFFGSIFKDGSGSESYLTFYDQYIIRGKDISPGNQGTPIVDWNFTSYEFADRNQCGQ